MEKWVESFGKAQEARGIANIEVVIGYGVKTYGVIARKFIRLPLFHTSTSRSGRWAIEL